MKKGEITRWLRKNEAAYVRLYGLEHWDIEFFVNGEDEEGLFGEVQMAPEYERASVILYAGNIPDEDQLVETVCHELEHVLTAPYALLWQTILPSLPDDAGGLANRFYMDAMELTRCNIGRFRKNALQKRL